MLAAAIGTEARLIRQVLLGFDQTKEQPLLVAPCSASLPLPRPSGVSVAKWVLWLCCLSSPDSSAHLCCCCFYCCRDRAELEALQCGNAKSERQARLKSAKARSCCAPASLPTSSSLSAICSPSVSILLSSVVVLGGGGGGHAGGDGTTETPLLESPVYCSAPRVVLLSAILAVHC